MTSRNTSTVSLLFWQCVFQYHQQHLSQRICIIWSYMIIIEYWSDDIIKMKFLKLWDLSGYSERTMSKMPTCQKLAIRGKIVSERLAGYTHKTPCKPFQFFFGVDPKKFRRVCMEFSKHSWARSQRQFAPKCSFLASRRLGHCSFRISRQIP